MMMPPPRHHPQLLRRLLPQLPVIQQQGMRQCWRRQRQRSGSRRARHQKPLSQSRLHHLQHRQQCSQKEMSAEQQLRQTLPGTPAALLSLGPTHQLPQLSGSPTTHLMRCAGLPITPAVLPVGLCSWASMLVSRLATDLDSRRIWDAESMQIKGLLMSFYVRAGCGGHQQRQLRGLHSNNQPLSAHSALSAAHHAGSRCRAGGGRCCFGCSCLPTFRNRSAANCAAG